MIEKNEGDLTVDRFCGLLVAEVSPVRTQRCEGL